MVELMDTPLTNKENYIASKRWHELFVGGQLGASQAFARSSGRWDSLISTPGVVTSAKAQLAYERASSGPSHFWRTADEAFVCRGASKPDVSELWEIVETEGLDSICLASLDPDDNLAWTFFVTHEGAARFIFKEVELDES